MLARWPFFLVYVLADDGGTVPGDFLTSGKSSVSGVQASPAL
jgi:hypothetical protein